MHLPDGMMAICFRCGSAKPRALDTCASCGTGPRTKRDYLVSTALSLFLSTEEELAGYRDEVIAGHPPSVPHEAFQRAIQALEDPASLAALRSRPLGAASGKAAGAGGGPAQAAPRRPPRPEQPIPPAPQPASAPPADPTRQQAPGASPREPSRTEPADAPTGPALPGERRSRSSSRPSPCSAPRSTTAAAGSASWPRSGRARSVMMPRAGRVPP